MILPAAPGPGARVSLVAASGPVPEGGIERALTRVRELGWEPLLGPSAASRDAYLAGSDNLRLADLSAAIASPENDLIWFLRGGYGMMRILPDLDLGPLFERPRPVIGFSDITAFHLAARKAGIVTLHGPHAATAELPDFSRDSLLRTLEPEPAGMLPFPPGGPARARTIVPGSAEGPLVGGNLALLAATMGTPYQVETAGSILFIEEVGEAAYRVDRLLTHLLLGGVIQRAAGIVIGSFSECPDFGTPGYRDAFDIIVDRLQPLGIPLASDFPFGHVPVSWTLPEGVLARLNASAGTLEILEPAVRG